MSRSSKRGVCPGEGGAALNPVLQGLPHFSAGPCSKRGCNQWLQSPECDWLFQTRPTQQGLRAMLRWRGENKHLTSEKLSASHPPSKFGHVRGTCLGDS